MEPLFLEYNKCGTCRKAKKWLDAHSVNYLDRPILEEGPTLDELTSWIKRSGVPVKRFFNTSGVMYKELSLKDKLPGMTDEEQIALLATDGRLVKRPVWVDDKRVLVGFKEEEWNAIIG
ncbi:MAG: arsenate reductase family protein [Marinifilaceae bacterium]